MNNKEKEMYENEKKCPSHKSIEAKGKVENQNQTHNSIREGMGPNTKRKSN